MNTNVAHLRNQVMKLSSKLSWSGPLLLRLTVGLVFISTGWGKLNSLETVTEFFSELHIPLPGLNARVAASTEFFGGLLVLVGLGTRFASLPLAFTMVVAIATAKWNEVDGIVSLVGLQEWAFLVMFLALAVIGPGAASLDALLARRFAVRKLPRPLLKPSAVGSATGA